MYETTKKPPMIDFNNCRWTLVYALNNCPDQFEEGPYSSREAAETAGRRKKGSGLTRYWTVRAIDDNETFTPTRP